MKQILHLHGWWIQTDAAYIAQFSICHFFRKPYLSAMLQLWQHCGSSYLFCQPCGLFWQCCASSYLSCPPCRAASCPVVRRSCCDACVLRAPWNTWMELGHGDSMVIFYSGSILTSIIDFKRKLSLSWSLCIQSRKKESQTAYVYIHTLWLLVLLLQRQSVQLWLFLYSVSKSMELLYKYIHMFCHLT